MADPVIFKDGMQDYNAWLNKMYGSYAEAIAAYPAISASAAAALLSEQHALASAATAAQVAELADASRTAAQDAAAQAAATYGAFGERYLGAKAAAPALDNDGQALRDGAMYWDTALNGGCLRVWNSGIWNTIPANVAAVVTITPVGNLQAVDVQGALVELDDDLSALSASMGRALAAKEPAIETGDATEYVAGDKSLRTFINDVRAATVGAVSLATATALAAADTVVQAFGKLQAQINAAVVSITGVQNRVGDAGGFTFRNRVINGACTVAQRGPVTFSLGFSAGYAGPDRFLAVTNTSGGSFTQALGALTHGGRIKSTVRQTVVAAISSVLTNNIWIGISQAIEGVNCYDLTGKPIVVSFVFNSNVAGTFNVSLRDGAGANSYVSTFVAAANTPVKVVIKLAAIPFAISNNTATGVQISVGAVNQATYQAGTLNAWTPGNFLTAAGNVNWAATAGNFIELTELQLEAGTINTEFEYLPLRVIENQCFRYYQTLTDFLIGGTNSATADYFLDITLPVKMRAAPTGSILGAPNYNNATNLRMNAMQTDKFRMVVTITGAGFQGYAYNALLSFTAEL